MKTPITLNAWIATLVALMAFTACEEVTDVTIEESKTYLVIEGGVFLSNTTEQHIRVSETVPFFKSENSRPVTNAIVRVSDGQQDVPFIHERDGSYKANIQIQAGKTYTLTVVYNGKTYQASAAMPALVEAQNMQLIYKDLTDDPFADGNKTGYAASIDMQDPAGTRNYYLYKLFVNGQSTFFADPGNRLNAIVDDQYFDGKFLRNVEVNNEWLAQPGDDVEVQLLNISKEQYDFYYTLFTLTSGNSLLGDPPPAPIQGNLRNVNDAAERVLGFFQVAARSSVNRTVE